MCRSELQSLKGVYPEFAESIAFFAVSVNPIDDTQTVAEFGERNGYPWPMAQPGEGMLESLRVTSHSTKVAFGPDGVIVYRAGFGKGNAQDWRELFKQLAAGAS